MYTLRVKNVNHALPLGLCLLRDEGQSIAPRGQSTLELPGVVATIYDNPRNMVLFDPGRDANPFFHFFEALWILAGRDDVAFLAHFNARMADFSDNGKTFHAPYGYRLRKHFQHIDGRDSATEYDQIELAINKLKADPDSRQAVLVIWDAMSDWERTKDVPCNDMIMLKIRDGKLRMTVCNRSNDVVWGAYGANVVQFSTLLVYMAGRIGVGVGEYTQISDSYHVYEENPYWQAWLPTHTAGVPPVNDPYENDPEVHNFFHDGTNRWMDSDDLASGNFDKDLVRFFQRFDLGNDFAMLGKDVWLTASFQSVALPMLRTHALWKAGERAAALGACSRIEAPDWRKACREWMQRRINK